MTEAVYGRWDLLVGGGSVAFPSWVEFTPDGGRFVGRVGSARPLSYLEVERDRIRFGLPPQYEPRKTNLEFEGLLVGELLHGEALADDGSKIAWEGRRAPSLARDESPAWDEPIELVGQDLSHWRARDADHSNHWSLTPDGLVNSAVGADLVTRDEFTDFRLEAEYSYPAGSNSGIYLRGRYEFQILDDYGQAPHVGGSGAIYGFLAPASNAVRPAGEVDRAEITLLGRRITVVLNGIEILRDEEIPGITGGALDSDEGDPGPIFVQGDHGPVTFHRLTLSRAQYD